MFPLLLIVSLAASLEDGSQGHPVRLEQQLRSLGLNCALVVASQAVDEYPVWSPDGRFLAADLGGHWVKLDLDALTIREGTWHGGGKIGVPREPAPLVPTSEKQAREWRTSAQSDPRRVTTRDGRTVELLPDGSGTRLQIGKKGAKPVTVWTTGLENCHSLAPSPDGKLVAFICETNGVVVVALP